MAMTLVKTSLLSLALATAVMLSSGISTAAAQSRPLLVNPEAGYCPAGTCNPRGAHYAKHPKYCKAEYCKRPRQASTR
jgi:hypothetical protein